MLIGGQDVLLPRTTPRQKRAGHRLDPLPRTILIGQSLRPEKPDFGQSALARSDEEQGDDTDYCERRTDIAGHRPP